MSPAERKRILHRVADGIDARVQELAEWETLDMGKPIAESSRKDIPRCAFNFRFFADYAEHLATKAFDQPSAGVFTYELREPLGVVAAISPWNFPLMLLTWKVAPALAFGCTVVAKPAEQSPITASILAEIVAEADVPPGVFNVVAGLRPGRGRGGADGPCGRRCGHVHRRVGDRADHHAERLGDAEEAVVRDGWEVGEHRVRRRRPGRGRRRRDHRGLQQPGRGVPGGHAPAGRTARSTTSSCPRFVDRAEALVVGDPRDPATRWDRW